ncbi:MAG: hypothetical protein NC429_06825 [Lachnospiraceae bacterium]|nr:hypothetical protein [Lachnospiraceae bacterium]
MADFFPDLFERFRSTDFLKKVLKKYHYEEEREAELKKVSEEMLPLMRREAFWESRESGAWSVFPALGDTLREKKADAVYEAVLMSLGSGLDRMQEEFHEQGKLSESYMLEALASELLLEGYSAYNRCVGESGKRHVARYHFPGSEEAFPLTMVPELLKEFNGPAVCNDAFCITPKKSVVFVAELTTDERIRCESVCAGCQNIHCPNRSEDDPLKGRMLARMADMPLSYGYSRILGRPY